MTETCFICSGDGTIEGKPGCGYPEIVPCPNCKGTGQAASDDKGDAK